jgi:hypothetical protein
MVSEEFVSHFPPCGDHPKMLYTTHISELLENLFEQNLLTSSILN